MHSSSCISQSDRKQSEQAEELQYPPQGIKKVVKSK